MGSGQSGTEANADVRQEVFFLPTSVTLQLGQFLSHRETNLRYLALESMCLLATSEFSHEAVKKHQETVINALKTERDVSVRQRAVDLLYAMCDRTNSEDIVLEMLTYLEVCTGLGICSRTWVGLT